MTSGATVSEVRETTPEERIAFADAALAVADHQVTDPVLRDLVVRAARHEITLEDAKAAAIHCVLG